jgi:hypothetical protein
MLLDIHHLFISWIPKNQDIRNSKFGLLCWALVLFFWAKNLQKEISFFFEKGIICHKFVFFLKDSKKYHKLIFKENITIVITIDHNFEETSENVSPE